MIRMSPRHALPLTALAALLLTAGLHMGASRAQERQPERPSADIATSAPNGGPMWRSLTAQQRRVLSPLAPQWETMDETAREKWLNVANRFDRLPASEQQRVRDRIKQWSNLPSDKRGEARLRFQQSRQLSAEERQRKWEAYQALPAEERDELTRQAQRRAKPIYLPDNMPGPREARQAFSTKRQPLPVDGHRKSNVAPPAVRALAPAPKIVTPSVVRAGTGATTNLVGQQPTPPLHQQSGLPKIATDKEFVDPITLLPRKGAQGAAIEADVRASRPEDAPSSAARSPRP